MKSKFFQFHIKLKTNGSLLHLICLPYELRKSYKMMFDTAISYPYGDNWCCPQCFKIWILSFFIFHFLILRQTCNFIYYLWKYLSNNKNTILGYKKGSKLKSDKWNMSATQTLWVVSFVTFVIRWAEHTSRGGVPKWGVLAPPQARKVSIWRTMSQHGRPFSG